MTDTSPIASTVLISLRPAQDSTAARTILGRTLAERQVEYAANLGCKKAILLSVGGGPEAIAARLRAEELGLKVLETSGPHGLSNCVRAEERLLVLQQDLLPAWNEWPEEAVNKGCVIVSPAVTGAEAGFERIDLARAWGGALVMPGSLLDGLLDLPEDSEAAPALLRIALQARLEEFELSDHWLSDGSWALVKDEADRKLVQEKWLAQHIAQEPSASASRNLAAYLLRKFGSLLLDKPVVAPAALGVSLALCAGAASLAWFGSGAISFALIALAALLMEGALGLRRLQVIPRQSIGLWSKMHLLLDAAIIACGVLSIEGDYFRQAFAPLVLVAAFHSGPRDGDGWLSRLRDRALVAGITAIVAAIWSVEAALMLASLLLLALNLAQNRRRRG